MTRAFIDLHCHTSASFDCLAGPPMSSVQPRTWPDPLAITDHDRIDGALAAREAAPERADRDRGGGDQDGRRRPDRGLPGAGPCRLGLSAAETVAAVREQGGLVGHPASVRSVAGLDAHGCADGGPLRRSSTGSRRTTRGLVGGGNERAAAFAREHGLAGVAVSDAHSVMEVGVAYTALDGDPSTPDGLLAALPRRRVRAGPGELRGPAVDARRQGHPACARQRPRSGPELRHELPEDRRPPVGRTIDRWMMGPTRRTVRHDGGHARTLEPRAAVPSAHAPLAREDVLRSMMRSANPMPSRCRWPVACASRGRSSRSPFPS